MKVKIKREGTYPTQMRGEDCCPMVTCHLVYFKLKERTGKTQKAVNKLA